MDQLEEVSQQINMEHSKGFFFFYFFGPIDIDLAHKMVLPYLYYPRFLCSVLAMGFDCMGTVVFLDYLYFFLLSRTDETFMCFEAYVIRQRGHKGIGSLF